ncbi:MAG: hypothetical protein IKE81_03565 [Clostridia bacterium]|nr:hypothetical protein [Clostridia bacterium]
MLTAYAGDFFFATASFQPQKHLTVRTFEIFIILSVLHPLHKLAGLGFPTGSQFYIFPVLSHAGFVISGKHTEKRNHIQRKPDKGEKRDAEECREKRDDQAGQKSEHSQIVCAVAALHEAGQSGLYFLPESHDKDSFLCFSALKRG